MANLLHAYLGPALVLVFCVSQAFRDVYFGHVFQGVDFFAVILLAFLPSTVLFTAIPLLRDARRFGKLRGQVAHRADDQRHHGAGRGPATSSG